MALIAGSSYLKVCNNYQYLITTMQSWQLEKLLIYRRDQCYTDTGVARGSNLVCGV